MMSEGDGFDVLEHVSSMETGAPIVVRVTAYPRERAAERAFDLGAVAYLSKPTTVRWRCSGKAYLLEGEHDSDALVSRDIYNLSATGAFLETKGPLPLGAKMNLLLSVGGHKARVRTWVARVQEPSWINVGGVGVTFIDSSAELEHLLEGAIQSMENEAENER
jgi:CheY-like chemotaxis protein